MTISKVKICNMALSNVGARNTIESLTEQSAEAKIVNLWYDHSRLLTLEGYNWNFAKKRQALALSTEDPPLNWTYRYVYPVDCVKAREIEQADIGPAITDPFNPFFNITLDALPFEVEMESDGESKSILTDQTEAVLIYTFDQENVGTYSTHFIYTLSYALAYNIAFPLTGKMSVQQSMFQSFNYLMKQAAQHDANEHVDRSTRDAQAIQARN